MKTARLALLMLCAPALIQAAEQPVVGPGWKGFTVAFIFIVILGGAAWALKTYGPMARVRKSTGLDIVGRLPLSPKASLALVRVGRTILLLGVTQEQVGLIKDLGETPFEKDIEASLTTRRVTP